MCLNPSSGSNLFLPPQLPLDSGHVLVAEGGGKQEGKFD